MKFWDLLKSVCFDASVIDATLWHKRLRAPWFVCTADGKFLGNGQIWRRQRNGKLEYKQDAETLDESLDRAW